MEECVGLEGVVQEYDRPDASCAGEFTRTARDLERGSGPCFPYLNG